MFVIILIMKLNLIIGVIKINVLQYIGLAPNAREGVNMYNDVLNLSIISMLSIIMTICSLCAYHMNEHYLRLNLTTVHIFSLLFLYISEVMCTWFNIMINPFIYLLLMIALLVIVAIIYRKVYNAKLRELNVASYAIGTKFWEL